MGWCGGDEMRGTGRARGRCKVCAAAQKKGRSGKRSFLWVGVAECFYVVWQIGRAECEKSAAANEVYI